MKRLAIFASGNGSNFQVLVERFPKEVEFVFSDHRDAYVLKRAEKLGVRAFAFERKDFATKVDYEAALVNLLDNEKIDLVLLAGYMKIIGPTLLASYEGKIVNIHPSYLPKHGGTPRAIEESHADKDGLGVTVHWVDSGVDTGKIIAQRKLPWIEDLDAYEASVHAMEYDLYPEVVRSLLND
ncbi:MAG: phosphoribosylglycinamide formyltransferase [Streptococcaceae bacterium]|jgi:phosphoribosylglycinamide formyltransferase-1|nr:phosphoribosylglycinamide formyltransferase [Streptococcaceae bacterium]